MSLKRLLALALLCLAFIPGMRSQNVGIKTNLISDAILSPNLGVEIGLAPKWTLDLSGQLNLWPINDHKWKHWLAQPEARYWFCERFMQSFLGFHVLGGQFNVGNIDTNINFLGSNFSKLKDRRYEGWAAGVGVAYGYAWAFAKHFNLEFEIGVGYVYLDYKKYSCGECSKLLGKSHHNYFGPTKAAINFEYLF